MHNHTTNPQLSSPCLSLTPVQHDLQGFLDVNKQKIQLTPATISRIFEEYVCYQPLEIDYKSFLDLILALENPKTPQSMQVRVTVRVTVRVRVSVGPLDSRRCSFSTTSMHEAIGIEGGLVVFIEPIFQLHLPALSPAHRSLLFLGSVSDFPIIESRCPPINCPSLLHL